MKTPEEILITNCPVFSSLFHDKQNKASVMMKESILKSMEEYKNQFIDFDGPSAMIDHYSRLARNWEDAHARLEEKLRIQYDAEFEAFKVSFEHSTRNDFEQQLNEAIHPDASEITALRQELDKRDDSIKKLLKINEELNSEIKAQQEIVNLQSVLKKRLEKAERDINELRNDSKSSSHIHSGGKGGWSV